MLSLLAFLPWCSLFGRSPPVVRRPFPQGNHDVNTRRAFPHYVCPTVVRVGVEKLSYHQASDLPPHRLLVLRRFFQDYKQLENKVVEVEEIAQVEMAYPVIEEALHRYSDRRRGGFNSL
jgi:Inorganic pyrophosphatase